MVRLPQRAFGQLPLRQRIGDALLEGFVQLVQSAFGVHPFRDVLEKDRHQPVLEGSEAEGRDFEMAAGDDQLVAEADRFSGAQDLAVERDPVVSLVGHHLAQVLADDVGNAGVAFIGGVGEDVDVIAERTMRPVEKLDDAEAIVHVLEQDAVDLAVQRGSLRGWARFRQSVLHDCGNLAREILARFIARPTRLVAVGSRREPARPDKE